MIKFQCPFCGREVLRVVMPDGREIEVDARSYRYGSIAIGPDGRTARVLNLTEYGQPDQSRMTGLTSDRFRVHAESCGER